MTKVDYMFVYGSLKKGGLFSDYLNENRLACEPANVGGVLIDIGGFPGLILSEEGTVRGELHLYKDFDSVINYCDRIEGFESEGNKLNLYNRRTIDLTKANGEKVEATMYEFNVENGMLDPDSITKRKIPNGNWEI